MGSVLGKRELSGLRGRRYFELEADAVSEAPRLRPVPLVPYVALQDKGHLDFIADGRQVDEDDIA